MGGGTCFRSMQVEQPKSNRWSSAGLSNDAFAIDGGDISTALQSLGTHSMSMTVLPEAFFDSSSTFRSLARRRVVALQAPLAFPSRKSSRSTSWTRVERGVCRQI